MPTTLTLSLCLDAGHVRLAELGVALLAAQEQQDHNEVLRLVDSILHLRLALEDAARLTKAGLEQQVVLAYLCETYGLVRALVDPFLRPNLPAIPTNGATVRYKVFALNAGVVLLNQTFLAAAGAELVPASEPETALA